MMVRQTVSIVFFLVLIIVTFPVSATPQDRANQLTARSKSGGLSVNNQVVTTSEDTTVLEPGDKLETGDGNTAQIQLDDDLLIDVTENTQITIEKFEHQTEERGFLFSRDLKTKEVKLNLEEGRILNTINDEQEDEEVVLDIKTPQAISGIRGTSFEVAVTNENQTELGVLEGYVTLRPVDLPGRTVELSPEQRSVVTDPSEAPLDPQPISTSQEKRLREHKRRAEQAFAPSPNINSLRFEDQSIEGNPSFNIYKSGDYAFEGRVTFPGQTEAGTMALSIEEQTQRLQASQSWEYKWSTAPPPIGDTVTLPVTLTATNQLGVSSSRTVNLRLTNPRPSGDLPWEYSLGQINYDIESIAGRPLDNISFPYQLNRSDLVNGGVMIELTSTDNVAGVAVSSNPSSQWTRVELDSNGQVQLDRNYFDRQSPIWIRTWSTDGTIGYPRRLGRYYFKNSTTSQIGRELVQRKWEAFQRERQTAITDFLTSDFIFESPVEDIRFDLSQYRRDFLRPNFFDWTGLNVDIQFRRTLMSPDGGKVEIFLELNGNQREPRFILTSEVQHNVERQSDGRYLIESIQLNNGIIYEFTDSLVLNHLEGVSLQELDQPTATSNCSKASQYDVCVDLVSSAGASISGDQGIVANPETTGSNAAHTMKYNVQSGSNLDSESLNEIKLIYGAGSDPSDVSSINSSADITTLTLGGTDVSGDISSVTPEDGGTTLNIGLGGSFSISEGDVIEVETVSDVVNPSSPGTYDVDVPINGKEQKTLQLDIVDNSSSQEIIPSSSRQATINQLSVSSLADVERLPDASVFSSSSQTLAEGDIYAVRSTFNNRNVTGLLYFRNINGGSNGTATIRVIVGKTLFREEGPESYPGIDLFN